jgi:phosphoglucosamine mutase
VLRSVTVAGDARAVVDGLAGAIAEAERALGADGRVLVRPSGTEPLVRVMVEAASAESAEAIAEQLVAAVEHAAG